MADGEGSPVTAKEVAEEVVPLLLPPTPRFRLGLGCAFAASPCFFQPPNMRRLALLHRQAPTSLNPRAVLPSLLSPLVRFEHPDLEKIRPKPPDLEIRRCYLTMTSRGPIGIWID